MSRDGADRRVERLADDLVDLRRVEDDRARQRDRADPGQPEHGVPGDDRALGDDDSADSGEGERPGEAEVLADGPRLVAERRAVGGDPEDRERADPGAGDHPDDQAPVAGSGDREADGDEEADERLEDLEPALAQELHPLVEDPERRLEDVRGDRQEEGEAWREEAGPAVEDGRQADDGSSEDEEGPAEEDLEREGPLEGELLVVVGLLDVAV